MVAENKNAIQVHQQHAVTPFEPEGLEQAYSLAQRLSKSGLIPDALRGKPDDVLVVLMTGRELGLQPMQALRLLAVVKGKAVTSADLLVGLVLSRKDVCEWFRLVESTDAKAVYQTKRVNSQPVTITFTIEQAAKAGLTGKDNWKNYPAAMLRARCSAALARAVYPDLCAGVYETSEAEDIQRGGGGRVVPMPVPIPQPAAGEVIEGQVVQSTEAATEPAPQPEAPAVDLDALTKSIAEAPSIEALKALVPQISPLPKEAKDEIRKRYAERLAELTGGVP